MPADVTATRDMLRLAGALRSSAERAAAANAVSIKPGRVVSVNSATRLAQVRLNGQNTSASVSWLGGAAPAVGDTVHVLVDKGAMTVLTGIHGTNTPTGTTTVIDNTITTEAGGWLFGDLEDRPPASIDSLGFGYLALDEEGGTPYACNGMSWVNVALPYGTTVGDITGGAVAEVTDAKWLAGNYDDRPAASADLLGCGWHSLDRPEDPAVECTGMSWVESAAGVAHTHADTVLLPEGIPDAVDIDALLAGHRGNGWMSGAVVGIEAIPAMSVAVTAGVGWHVNGTVTSKGAVRFLPASTAISAADPSLPRLDLIVVIDTGGGTMALDSILGTPAVSPVLPEVPGGVDALILAAVRVEPGATTITTPDITDMRVLIPPPSIVHTADFGVTGQFSQLQRVELQAAIAAAKRIGKPVWLDGSNPSWSASQNAFITYINVDVGPSGLGVDARGGNVRIYGAGVNYTKIRMLDTAGGTSGTPTNAPLLTVDGSWNELDGFELSYLPTTTPHLSTDSNARALYIPANASNLSTLCRYSNLWIRNSGIGIYGPTAFFSNHVDTIKIEGFSRYAIFLGVANSGSTGNIFDNIYIHNNGFPSSTQNGSGNPDVAFEGVHLLNFTDSVFNQLNIEWARLNYGINLDDCGTIKFSSLHFEGFVGNISDGAFVYTNGNAHGCRVLIDAMFAFTTRIDGDVLLTNGGTNSYSLFRADGANDEIEVHGIDIHEYGAWYWKWNAVTHVEGTTDTQNATPNAGVFRRLYGRNTWTNGSAIFTGQYLPIVNAVDATGIAGGEAVRARPMVRLGGNYPNFSGFTWRHMVCAPAALPTTAKHGFLYIPSGVGPPTGIPTTEPGCVPLYYDTQNLRLYAYAGAPPAWRIH